MIHVTGGGVNVLVSYTNVGILALVAIGGGGPSSIPTSGKSLRSSTSNQLPSLEVEMLLQETSKILGAYSA